MREVYAECMNDTYQRETLSEQPIRQPLRMNCTSNQIWAWCVHYLKIIYTFIYLFFFEIEHKTC